jgi:hypothetical protein
MPYLWDANVFIEAKNRYYDFSFCPAYWDWIVRENREGTVFSLERVRDELVAGHDALARWVSEREPGFFLAPDQATLDALTRVSEWVMSKDYTQAAISTFLASADYYLVGHALAHGFTVVTHEVASDSRKKIKIPNACSALGVAYSGLFQVLATEKAMFVLG